MRSNFLKLLLVFVLFAGQLAQAQTGTYTQTKPNMQSVYSATSVTFTGTPANTTNGTLSCSWIGCQDVGYGNPTIYFQIYLNGQYTTLTNYSTASMCSPVPFNYSIPASTLATAIQSGGGSVMMRVYVSDACPAGMGCSFYNDPVVNNLTLSYSYSQASLSATSTALCPGGSTTFTNTTPGTATSMKWYFPGGTPSTSTVANPVVSYAAAGSYNVTLVSTSSAGTDSSVFSNYITVNPLPPAVVTPASSTTVCSGTKVVLNANSGAGMTYQWQKNNVAIAGATTSGYSASTTGTYRVLETNSFGCSAASAGVTVTVNPKPAATITSGLSTTICPGDSVVLTANSGSGYTYTWKKSGTVVAGATGSVYAAKATGNYSTIVSNAFGCTKTSNIIAVAVNTPKATITASGSLTVCNGNGVTLKANTGAGLTYQWKLNNVDINGATDSIYIAYTSGSYRVKVTNSCGSATATAKVVTINPLPTISISALGTTSFCTGGSVNLTAAGDTGLTYQWRKNNVDIAGATASSYLASTTGSYTVKVTNSFGCNSTSNAIQVTANTTVANITANGPTSFCNGDSVKLSANTGANLTYQWTKNSVSINGATAADYTAKVAGTYRVNVTNTYTGCAKTSSSVQVVVNCRLADGTANNTLDLLATPNPFTGITELHLIIPGSTPALLEVFAVDGKLISTQTIDPSSQTMSLGEELSAGTYIVKLTSGSESKSLRLVKNQ